ncbi:unnamed protein product [Ophioblennius macclurei]
MADDGDPPTLAAVLQSAGGNGSSSPAAVQVAKVMSWLSFSLGLPAIALAVCVLRNLAKGGGEVPVHVVLLLLSDVFGFFGRPSVSHDGEEVGGAPLSFSSTSVEFVFYLGLISNVTLMVVIAQERHQLVACPRCEPGCCVGGGVRRSSAALLAWAFPVAVLALAALQLRLWFAVALLTAFPVLLFFAADSWRALLCTPDPPRRRRGRRRVVWGISAIWANYTFLYSPFILVVLLEALAIRTAPSLRLASHLLLYLGPLVDPLLYTLATNGPQEVLQAALNWWPNLRPKENSPSRIGTVSETVETRL